MAGRSDGTAQEGRGPCFSTELQGIVFPTPHLRTRQVGRFSFLRTHRKLIDIDACAPANHGCRRREVPKDHATPPGTERRRWPPAGLHARPMHPWVTSGYERHQNGLVKCRVEEWYLAGFISRSCGFESRPCDLTWRGVPTVGAPPAPEAAHQAPVAETGIRGRLRPGSLPGMQVRLLPGALVLGSGLAL